MSKAAYGHKGPYFYGSFSYRLKKIDVKKVVGMGRDMQIALKHVVRLLSNR